MLARRVLAPRTVCARPAEVRKSRPSPAGESRAALARIRVGERSAGLPGARDAASSSLDGNDDEMDDDDGISVGVADACRCDCARRGQWAANVVWHSASVGYGIPNRHDSLRPFQPRPAGTEACFAAHVRAAGGRAGSCAPVVASPDGIVCSRLSSASVLQKPAQNKPVLVFAVRPSIACGVGQDGHLTNWRTCVHVPKRKCASSLSSQVPARPRHARGVHG
jgi:hypothetical protein